MHASSGCKLLETENSREDSSPLFAFASNSGGFATAPPRWAASAARSASAYAVGSPPPRRLRRPRSRLSSPPRPSAGRRVVVTGLGAVTPLGRGVGPTWDRLVAGGCAVRALAAEDLRLPGGADAGRTLEQLPSRVAAPVPRGKGDAEFDEEAWTKVAYHTHRCFISPNNSNALLMCIY